MGHTVEDDGICAASLMVKLNHQRTQAQFCDCVIRKGGQVYPVHRCILAASSPVLASLLYSCGVLVELEAPCLSDCILGYLLDYIYTGTLPHLDYKLYLHLLAAAQYLEMDELQHTIRTKTAEALEYYNRTDEATGFALIPTRSDFYKSPEAPLCCSSESKNTLGTHLSSDAKNKEEAVRSHPFVSTEVQQNEQTQDETTPELCKHGMVKREEMQSNSEDKNHNSSSCSTSVIRHSGRVTRVDEENVAIKLPPDTEPCTGQTLTDRTSCVSAEEVKTPNHHFDKQDLKYKPSYEYSMCSVNLLMNNEKDSNNEKYVPDNRHREHSQMQDISSISKKNASCNSSVDNVAVAFADEVSDTSIKCRNKGTCVKRKLKEKNSDKRCKSEKTDLACSASVETEINTDSFYNNEQEATLENMNAPTTKGYRSLSMPTCQPAHTDTSYSGQLFYHCESRASRIPFAPNSSPTFSDPSSEDNVSLFSTLCQTAALGAGEVVLLDIRSKSSEMSASHKRTAEMGTRAADVTQKRKTGRGKSQNSDGEYQDGNDGADILTTSLTSRTSGCSGEYAPNSALSVSVSDLTPSSRAQTNLSAPSSPVRRALRCSLCARSFSQRGSLNRHVRSHLGVRPFPCPRCPMSFSRQYRVAEHMRVHQPPVSSV